MLIHLWYSDQYNEKTLLDRVWLDTERQTIKAELEWPNLRIIPRKTRPQYLRNQ